MQKKLKNSSNQSISPPIPSNPEINLTTKNTKNNNNGVGGGSKDFHEKNGRHMSIITVADSANDNKSKDKGSSSLSSGMVSSRL